MAGFLPGHLKGCEGEGMANQELQTCKNNDISINVVIGEGDSREEVSKRLSAWGLHTLLTVLEIETAEDT